MSRRQRSFGAIVIAVGLILFVSANSASAAFENIELAKSSEITLQSRWNELDVFRKSAAYIKRLTPFYTWINLCNAVDGADSAFLLGQCLYEQSRWILRLPPDQFRDQYEHTIDSLWSKNELDAITFADATLGQSYSDQAVQDLASLAQLALVGFFVFRLLRRRFDFTRIINAIRPMRSKVRVYAFISGTIWLAGGTLLQIAILNSSPSSLLLNLDDLIVIGFGTLTVLLVAACLVVRPRASERNGDKAEG